MGRLRTEPKKKPLLSKPEYQRIQSVLQEAQRIAKDNHVFWDLDEGERPSKVKKHFLHVARNERIDISIRQVRGAKSLAINFKKPRKTTQTRMSAAESRRRIMKCLQSANQPLKKGQIIKMTGISASTWNIRIKELLNMGKVARHGNRRDTTYTIK